ELRESLQQQTATADVLKVISRSTFDLQTVFKTLVESAARVCRADKANIALLKDNSFEYFAAYGFQPDYLEYMRSLRRSVARESLQQQTATSDVLSVISGSPGDLQPVFDAMLANAVRVCDAQVGILWRREGDGFSPGAMHGVPPNLTGVVPTLWRPSPESMLA